jgi:hypothetical protein
VNSSPSQDSNARHSDGKTQQQEAGNSREENGANENGAVKEAKTNAVNVTGTASSASKDDSTHSTMDETNVVSMWASFDMVQCDSSRGYALSSLQFLPCEKVRTTYGSIVMCMHVVHMCMYTHMHVCIHRDTYTHAYKHTLPHIMYEYTHNTHTCINSYVHTRSAALWCPLNICQVTNMQMLQDNYESSTAVDINLHTCGQEGGTRLSYTCTYIGEMSKIYPQRTIPASPQDVQNFDQFTKTRETTGTPSNSESAQSSLQDEKDAVLTGVGFNYTSDMDAVATKKDTGVSWVVSSARLLGGLEKDARIRSIRLEGMDMVDLRHEHGSIMQKFGKIGCDQVCSLLAVAWIVGWELD